MPMGALNSRPLNFSRRSCPYLRYNSTGLVGNVENTDIGWHIAENMRLNLDGAFCHPRSPLRHIARQY